MKKAGFCAVALAAIMCVILVGCGIKGEKKTVDSSDYQKLIESMKAGDYSIDFETAESFEAAINDGEDILGKVVKFTVSSIHPDSALGYTLWAGEHLNFVGEVAEDVGEGDTVIAVVNSIQDVVGSWAIGYDILNVEPSNGTEYHVEPEKDETTASDSPPVSQQQQDQKEEKNMAQSDITSAFASACSDVGIDVNKIKNWERMDDWYNGERYAFTYENMGLKVYFNYDKSVNSISIGNTNDIKLYDQGYEPYNVADYIVDVDTAYSLVPLAEEQIKSHLNYPSTAKFSLLDWSYGRQKNTYYLQSSLTAKNGFGVKDDISFSCAYEISGKSTSLVYLAIDAKVYVNNIQALPERKIITTSKTNENNSNNEEIRLIDGQLGEYGKKDPKYPEYVDYYLPIGNYSVKNNAKTSIVMIIDDKSNDEVSRITLSSGESGEISIKNGQHIELTIYSDVSLTKK